MVESLASSAAVAEILLRLTELAPEQWIGFEFFDSKAAPLLRPFIRAQRGVTP
jgi:hypothetical protein